MDYICIKICTNVQEIQFKMTIEEIINKVEYGDYPVLAEMLGVRNPQTAKKRFLRGDDKAKEAMEIIVTTRENMIKTFKTA